MEENVQLQQPSEMQIIATTINAGLKAFEDRKKELTELRDKVSGLDIKSVDDKAAILEVSTARKTLKNARVAITKEGLSMRTPLNKINDTISAKEKELVAIIEPTEKDLLAKEQWVKDEQARIEREAEEKKQAVIQGRIDRLAAYEYELDPLILAGITDQQFEKILNDAFLLFERDQAAKAENTRLEEEKKAQAEKDRLELEELRKQQTEISRKLKEQQDELDRIAADTKRKKQEVEEEESRKYMRELEVRANLRIQQMVDFGLTFDFSDNHYKGFGCFVPILDIKCHDEKEWDKLIKEVTPAVERGKKKKEEEAEAKRLKDIEDASLKAIEDERERQRLATEQEAENRRLAELKKEQDLAVADDKTKYKAILDYLKKTPLPEMKSKEFKAKRNVIVDFLKDLA